MRISVRTITFVASGLAIALGSFLLAEAVVLDATAQLAVVNLTEPLVLCACALMVFWTASQFAPGEPLRRQWMPIGAGLLLFALGDVIYGAYEIALGSAPASPGLPDLLYAACYPLIALGILRAASGYRRLVDLRPLVGLALAGGVALTALIVVPLASVASAVDGQDLPAAAVQVLFPVADVLFVITPAILMLLIAAKMRGARLAAPWIAVALGGVVFAAADIWFLAQELAGTYVGGQVGDIGWMVGGIFIAAGASIAVDVNVVRSTSHHSRSTARHSESAPNPTA